MEYTCNDNKCKFKCFKTLPHGIKPRLFNAICQKTEDYRSARWVTWIPVGNVLHRFCRLLKRLFWLTSRH